MNSRFNIVLHQKEGADGLIKSETIDMIDMLTGDSYFPLEIEANGHECCAMGFIDVETAEYLDYDYTDLDDFVAEILDDVEKEHDDCIYDFNGCSIWLSYGE